MYAQFLCLLNFMQQIIDAKPWKQLKFPEMWTELKRILVMINWLSFIGLFTHLTKFECPHVPGTMLGTRTQVVTHLWKLQFNDPGTPHLIINEGVGEPCWLQTMGSQRVQHDWATGTHGKLKKVKHDHARVWNHTLGKTDSHTASIKPRSFGFISDNRLALFSLSPIMAHILQLDKVILLPPKYVTSLNASGSMSWPDLASLLCPREDWLLIILQNLECTLPRVHPCCDISFFVTQKNYILSHVFSHSPLCRHVL